MATLSSAEIISDVLDAYKTRFPLLTAISTDFSAEEARLGQTITGRIASLPTVRDYDATDGYKANAANANDMTTDVSVTISNHKHVPVKIDYIDQIKTKRNLYNEVIGQLAFALGKKACDDALALITAANFTHSVTDGTPDLSTLNTIAGTLNGQGAAPVGRFGIVNSATYQSLENDEKIASGNYHGQQRTSNAYGNLSNIAGFGNIFEYPDLATASSYTNISGFFADRSSIVMAARVPSDYNAVAAQLGIPSIASTEVVSDPDTGLSIMGITYQEAGTFDIYTTMVMMYGFVAGTNGGSADDLLDNSAVVLASA